MADVKPVITKRW